MPMTAEQRREKLAAGLCSYGGCKLRHERGRCYCRPHRLETLRRQKAGRLAKIARGVCPWHGCEERTSGRLCKWHRTRLGRKAGT